MLNSHLSAGQTRLWLRHLALPIALHFALCLGVFQVGLTETEMKLLHIKGPSHLIDPYIKATRVFGPLGILRAYFRGEADERLYLEYADLLLHGRLNAVNFAKRTKDDTTHYALPARPWPYRDVRVEYPPLIFLAVVPPALFALDYVGYRRGFIVYMVLLNFLNLWLAWRLLSPQLESAAASTPVERARRAGRVLYWSLAFFAALGLVVVTRMDHLAVTWSLLTLTAFHRAQTTAGHRRLAWAAACGGIAALGVMTKLVPGLVALAALVLWLQSEAPDRYRCALACAAAGGLTLFVLNAGMLALAGDRYLDTYRYHALRGVQIESLYSGLLMVCRNFGLAMRVEDSFGSTNLVSSATGLVKQASPCLFGLATGYVLLRRRFSADALGATVLSCVLLLIFMLTNRVFSPQYVIWVAAPLFVVAAHQPQRGRLWWSFLIAVLWSQLIYPRGYPLLKTFHPIEVVLLNARNGLLIVFAVQLVRTYSTQVRSRSKTVS